MAQSSFHGNTANGNVVIIRIQNHSSEFPLTHSSDNFYDVIKERTWPSKINDTDGMIEIKLAATQRLFSICCLQSWLNQSDICEPFGQVCIQRRRNAVETSTQK